MKFILTLFIVFLSTFSYAQEKEFDFSIDRVTELLDSLGEVNKTGITIKDGVVFVHVFLDANKRNLKRTAMITTGNLLRKKFKIKRKLDNVRVKVLSSQMDDSDKKYIWISAFVLDELKNVSEQEKKLASKPVVISAPVETPQTKTTKAETPQNIFPIQNEASSETEKPLSVPAEELNPTGIPVSLQEVVPVQPVLAVPTNEVAPAPSVATPARGVVQIVAEPTPLPKLDEANPKEKVKSKEEAKLKSKPKPKDLSQIATSEVKVKKAAKDLSNIEIKEESKKKAPPRDLSQ